MLPFSDCERGKCSGNRSASGREPHADPPRPDASGRAPCGGGWAGDDGRGRREPGPVEPTGATGGGRVAAGGRGRPRSGEPGTPAGAGDAAGGRRASGDPGPDAGSGLEAAPPARSAGGAGRDRPLPRDGASAAGGWRLAAAGRLGPLDGSPPAWLAARGPRLTLVAAMDDATGRREAAVFRAPEDAPGDCLRLWRSTRLAPPPSSRPEWPARRGGRQSGRGVPDRPPRPTPSHPVGPGARRPADPRHRGPLPSGQGPRGTALRDAARPLGGRAAPGGGGDRLEAANAGLEAANAGLEAANAGLPSSLPRFTAQFAVPAPVAERASRPLAPTQRLEASAASSPHGSWPPSTRSAAPASGCRSRPTPPRRSSAQATFAVHDRLDGRLAVWSGGPG